MMISYALSPSPWSGVLKRPDTIMLLGSGVAFGVRSPFLERASGA